MAKLIVTDTKGVVVATWSRETITVQPGEEILKTPLGGYAFAGKMLNLAKEVVEKLVRSKRVELAE